MSVSLVFEHIGSDLYRAKVFGGWLVKYTPRLQASTEIRGEIIPDGTDYHSRGIPKKHIALEIPTAIFSTMGSVTFIPDPFFLWGTEAADAVS